MMYPYLTFSDETEVSHSHILEINCQKIIEVHFERPTENGFDSARYRLPAYKWIKREGYSDAEILKFENFLHCNAHLLYKYSANGGIAISKRSLKNDIKRGSSHHGKHFKRGTSF